MMSTFGGGSPRRTFRRILGTISRCKAKRNLTSFPVQPPNCTSAVLQKCVRTVLLRCHGGCHVISPVCGLAHNQHGQYCGQQPVGQGWTNKRQTRHICLCSVFNCMELAAYPPNNHTDREGHRCFDHLAPPSPVFRQHQVHALDQQAMHGPVRIECQGPQAVVPIRVQADGRGDQLARRRLIHVGNRHCRLMRWPCRPYSRTGSNTPGKA